MAMREVRNEGRLFLRGEAKRVRDVDIAMRKAQPYHAERDHDRRELWDRPNVFRGTVICHQRLWAGLYSRSSCKIIPSSSRAQRSRPCHNGFHAKLFVMTVPPKARVPLVLNTQSHKTSPGFALFTGGFTQQTYSTLS